MRRLFEQTYPTIENRLIAYCRKELKARGYKGDIKNEAERIAQAAASRTYEECTLDQCLKYGKGKGNTEEECMREGLIILIFIKAKNELSNFFRPKPKKGPPQMTFGSFISTLGDESEPTEDESEDEKLKKIQAFLPPDVLRLFQKVAAGANYQQLAKEERTTVSAITQRIHRWRKKLKRHMKST